MARIVEDWARERPGLDTSPLEVLARLHRAY
ncbi:MarR family transcriptional regulator, partial [Streptomyces chartreusis]